MRLVAHSGQARGELLLLELHLCRELLGGPLPREALVLGTVGLLADLVDLLLEREEVVVEAGADLLQARLPVLLGRLRVGPGLRDTAIGVTQLLDRGGPLTAHLLQLLLLKSKTLTSLVPMLELTGEVVDNRLFTIEGVVGV